MNETGDVHDTNDSKGRWSRRVSTILEADETVREMNETLVRLNTTLDEFDRVLSGFAEAMGEFVQSVEGFDRVVGRMDGDLMPRIDTLVGKAEAILSGAAIPALGNYVFASIRKAVGR